jgi:hypothetical protein
VTQFTALHNRGHRGAGSPRAATTLDTKLVVNDVPGPPSPFDFQPPGETTGPPTNFQEFGTQPDFYFAKGDYPYEVSSDGSTGTYSVHESVSNVFGTDSKEDVVFDSTGAAPADGTVYDTYLSELNRLEHVGKPAGSAAIRLKP